MLRCKIPPHCLSAPAFRSRFAIECVHYGSTSISPYTERVDNLKARSPHSRFVSHVVFSILSHTMVAFYNSKCPKSGMNHKPRGVYRSGTEIEFIDVALSCNTTLIIRNVFPEIATMPSGHCSLERFEACSRAP